MTLPNDDNNQDENCLVLPSHEHALPRVYVSKRQYAFLILFTFSCYVGSMNSYQILDQYIFHRYADELGVPGGGLNKNVSSCFINRSDPDYELQTKAHEKASTLNFYSSLLSGIPQPFSVLIIGAYSDTMGRKLSIGIPWAGMVCTALIQLFWIQFDMEMYIYLISQLPSAFTGGYASLIGNMFAFLSDTTTPEQRSFGLALGEAGLGLSIFIGSIVCGWLIRLSGFQLPFYLMFGLLLLSGVFLWPLPETSPAVLLRRHWKLISKSQNSSTKQTEESTTGTRTTILCDTPAPWKMLVKAFHIYTTNAARARLLIVLSFVYFVELFASIGSSSLLTLYLLNQPFCWDSVNLGYYRGVYKVVLNITCVLMIGLFRRHLGDTILLTMGVLSFTFYNEIMGIAGLLPNPWDHVAAASTVVIGMFGGMIVPLVRSMLSQTVKPSETGALFGSLGALLSIAYTTGSMTGNAVYKETVSSFPGTLFITQGLLVFSGIFFILIFHVLRKRTVNSDELTLIDPVS